MGGRSYVITCCAIRDTLLHSVLWVCAVLALLYDFVPDIFISLFYIFKDILFTYFKIPRTKEGKTLIFDVLLLLIFKNFTFKTFL